MWWMPSSFMTHNRIPAVRPCVCAPGRACDHRPVQDGSLIPRFGRARRDPSLAVLEGLHPLKHALRFGARILEVVCSDRAALDTLAAELAPDVRQHVRALARPVAPAVFAKLAPLAPSTGVIALAACPAAGFSRV